MLPCAVSPSSVRPSPSITFGIRPPAPAGGWRTLCAPSAGAGADNHQLWAQRGKPRARHEEAGGGRKKPGGRKRQRAREGRERANPSRPLLPRERAPPPGEGARTAHDHHQQTRREGMAADRPAGAKTAKGGNGPRGPPREGPGGTLPPAVRIFLRIPWRVRAPPAAHCGAGARAGEERGHDGAANPRRRPAGPPTNPPPPALWAVCRAKGASEPAQRAGSCATNQPTTRRYRERQAPPLSAMHQPTGAYERSEFATTVQGRPTPARIVRARAGDYGAWGVGRQPHERAGPSRPEGASEGARAILPAGRHGKAPFT